MASIATLDAILAQAREAIVDAVGKGTPVLDFLNKIGRQYKGKSISQPVYTTDATGIAAVAAGGNYPAVGDSTPVELTIPWAYLLARFNIDGPAIEAAGGDFSQLKNTVQNESERLVSSVNRWMNRRAMSGRTVIGFLNERKNDTDKLWELSGDVAKLAAAIVVAGAPVQCTTIRMDTYATIGNNNISTADAATGLITVDGALDTSAVASEYAIALVYSHDASFNNEPRGLYELMGVPTYYGVDRTTAAGDALLQANVLTVGVAAGAAQRGAPTLARIEALMDLISERTRGEAVIDTAFVHSRQIAGLKALLQANTIINVDVSGKGPKEADAGLKGFYHGGVQYLPDVDMGKGLIVLADSSRLKSAMLRKGDFVNDDGNGPLYQSATADNVQGLWKKYYQVFSDAPNFMGALAGMDFPGAGDGTT